MVRKKRFFISNLDKEKNIFFIGDREYHHLVHVLRLKEGDVVYGIDENANEYVGFIEKLEKDKAVCKIVKQEQKKAEKKVRYSIMQSIIKEKKMSVIMEKSVELGVEKIYPLISERSSFFEDTDFFKKQERWQKIVHDSAKQSGYLELTKIEPIINIKDFKKINLSAFTDIILLAPFTENHMEKIFQTWIQEHKEKNILAIIGPEGGFTEKEEEFFINNGAMPVKCMDNLLRAETAAIYISSVLNLLDQILVKK